MTYHYRKTYGYIKALKPLGIPIVCGGAHVNSKGPKVMDEADVDFLIKGEGEKSLLSLLHNINNPEAFSKIPGLIYRKNGSVIENSPEIIDVDSLGFPKYKNFSLDKYADGRILIQTSRGCPYQCTFCQQASLLGKKWRARSPQNIMDEIEYWGSLGKTNLVFSDDNLTLDKKRIQELCRLMQKSKYRFHIETAGVRIDNVDFETLKMMKDAGFYYLSFGIESGSDRVLKEIRKGITLGQIHKTLEMSSNLNFEMKLYFIINNRTETYEEAQQSFILSRQYPISLARFTNLCPFPGTYDYEWILKHGRLLYPPEEYLNNPNEFINKPIYDGPGMSLEERVQIIKDAETELARPKKSIIHISKSRFTIPNTPAASSVHIKMDDVKETGFPQRVLFVNHNLYPFEFSGTPLSTLNHALGMAQRGLEVAVLITGQKINKGWEKQPGNGFTLYKVPAIEKFEAYFASPEQKNLEEYRRSIDRIIDDFRPQIVQLNDYVYMPAEIIEIFSNRGCLVVRNVCNCEELCHQNYPVLSTGPYGRLCSGPESPDKCGDCFRSLPDTVVGRTISQHLLSSVDENIRRRFEYIKKAYRDTVDKVIFTSDPFKTYLTRFIPIPEEKLKVIPRGFKFNFPREINGRTGREGKVHFAFVGNIMFSKGIDVVLQAFQNICKDHDFTLHIYGWVINPEYGQWIEKLKADFPDKFIFHGHYKENNLPDIASHIDACIIPSYFDTYNRVLREFLYMGIPVIVTDFFGAYIVDDGINGFKIPVGDADALAGKMTDIIQNPEILEHVAGGAAQTKIPSLEEEIDSLLDTYNDLYNRSSEAKRAALDEMRHPVARQRGRSDKTTRLIAFYLPQYHPIPENDRWWGTGFTEWRNVVKAKPLFPWHYQPHLPADLGFYDLRLPEIRRAQADLAREHGIHGFCYYHYWFNGKMLLDYPLQEVLKSGEPDFPFCLCWANENWTRAWDGRQGEVLIQQNYSEEDDRNHVRWLLNIFKDSRYIRINNKPLMLIYLSKSIPDAARTATIWREEAKKAGEDIYLCKMESATWEYGDPRSQGFDACVEFQPDWGNLEDLNRRVNNGHFVFDYGEVAEKMISKPIPSYKRFPCVTPMWDNSPRRKQAAVILDRSTPDKYQKWLSTIIETIDDYKLDDNIIFINAWNEWAEGNHLEPDEKNGKAYLIATKNALSMSSGPLINPEKRLVSIVILTFNQLEYTKMCVKSIQEHTPEPHEIIFVDNGSTDGTAEYLQDLAEGREHIHLILNKKNLGFAAGNNQALKQAKGDHVLLLNNDVVVTERWLETLISHLEQSPEIGMAGPMSNSASGPQMVEKVVYGKDMEAMQRFAGDFAWENAGKTSETIRLVGFCLLVKKEVLDVIGGLDENYVSGNFEDDDLCLRSFIAGYRNIIAQDVFIHHFGSMTFKGNAIDYRATTDVNKKYFAGKWKEILDVNDNAYTVHMPKESQLIKINEWGEARFSEGDLKTAVKIFERALKLDRGNSQALNNLGVIQWQLGDPAAAMKTFQTALTFNPKDIDAIGNLIQAATETGRFDLIDPGLLEVLKRSQPENPDIETLIKAHMGSAGT